MLCFDRGGKRGIGDVSIGRELAKGVHVKVIDEQGSFLHQLLRLFGLGGCAECSSFALADGLRLEFSWCRHVERLLLLFVRDTIPPWNCYCRRLNLRDIGTQHVIKMHVSRLELHRQ